MKSKRTKRTVLWVALAAALLVCGTTLAYMFRQSSAIQNLFNPAKVDCVVQERFDGTSKTSITVKNTGNIDAYLRVRFVTYWVDAEGEIVARPSASLNIKIGEGWLKGSNDTYYYAVPVKPDEFTEEMLAGDIVLAEEDGYQQVVEVFADAIQSEPDFAVTSSWGVEVDTDNKITDVE